MSQENADLIRSLIPPPETDMAALLRDDALFDQMASALGALVDPDVECVAVWQGGTVHTGIDGFRKLWLDWMEPWASYNVRIDEVIDAGDRVVVLAHDWGRRHDVEREVEIQAGSIWEVRDGKVAKVAFHPSREDTLAAAGIEAG